MKYVLDASVALKMMLNESGSALALKLQDDFRNKVHELIAPDILPAEMGHVLTKAERQGIIPKGQGMTLFLDFINPCPQLFPNGDLFERAMEISSDMRIGLFDCFYVALAEQEGCELVTADLKMMKNLPGFPVVDLATL